MAGWGQPDVSRAESGDTRAIQARPRAVRVGPCRDMSAFPGPLGLCDGKHCPWGCVTGRRACCHSMLELWQRKFRAVWECVVPHRAMPSRRIFSFTQ